MKTKNVTLHITAKEKDEDDALTDIQTLVDILTSGKWKKFICERRNDGSGYPELETVDISLSQGKVVDEEEDDKLVLDHNLGITGLDKIL